MFSWLPGVTLLWSSDSADQILNISRENFAPGAVDSAYQEVVWYFAIRRTNRTMDVSRAEFDLLRRKAESKMQMGGANPEAFASELRMSHSVVLLPEKSLISASGQGNLGFPAVAK